MVEEIEKIQTLVEEKIEKKRKERFKTFPTYLPGIQLRVEPKVELDILRKTIEELSGLARDFTKTKWEIDKLMEGQSLRRENIIDIAKKHEGLRGLISEEDNFVLTVGPSEKTTYDRELLKESLGIAYPAIVRETLAVSVLIPVGFITEREITISEAVIEKEIRDALIRLGLSEEDIVKVMEKKILITLDEKKLNKMIKEEQVNLQPEARKTEITWRINVDSLKP